MSKKDAYRLIYVHRFQSATEHVQEHIVINPLERQGNFNCLPYFMFLSADDAIYLTLPKVSRRDATVNQTRPFFPPPQRKRKKAVWPRETSFVYRHIGLCRILIVT